jgi:hypothetical protein
MIEFNLTRTRLGVVAISSARYYLSRATLKDIDANPVNV